MEFPSQRSLTNTWIWLHINSAESHTGKNNIKGKLISLVTHLAQCAALSIKGILLCKNYRGLVRCCPFLIFWHKNEWTNLWRKSGLKSAESFCNFNYVSLVFSYAIWKRFHRLLHSFHCKILRIHVDMIFVFLHTLHKPLLNKVTLPHNNLAGSFYHL